MVQFLFSPRLCPISPPHRARNRFGTTLNLELGTNLHGEADVRSAYLVGILIAAKLGRPMEMMLKHVW